MKIKHLIISFISMGLLFSACTKVIDVDLNSTNPVPVVDAKILKDSTTLVKLSYTSDYFNNESSSFIENAQVKISNQNNEIEYLEYVSEGLYKGNQLIGSIHSNYKMEITFDDKEYTAESELLQPTEIVDFYFEESNSNNPTSNKTVYAPIIKFLKTSDKTNYFMIRYYVNGEIDGDRYTTLEYENPKDTIVFEPFRKRFDANELVTIRIYSISKETREYYQQLNDSQGGMMNSSTPYNAKSNFGSGILGFFVASSYDEMTAIAE